LLGTLAIPVFVVAACVGSDPVVTPTPEDGGTGGTASSSGNNASSSSGSSGPTDGGGGGDSATAPECSKITVSTLAGSGSTGFADGDGGTDAEFNVPIGIAAKGDGSVFVADSMNGTIRLVTETGKVTHYATGMAQPLRLAYSATNGLYVADATNDQLFRVTGPDTFQKPGVIESSIVSVGIAPNADVYVASNVNCGIHRLNAAGTATTLFVGNDGTTTCGLKDGAKTSAQFSQSIVDFAFKNTTLFAADDGNHAIRAVETAVGATEGQVTTIAGGTQAHTDGKGKDAAFEVLGGVTYDSDHDVLYVTDKSTIRRVALTGEVTTIIGTPGYKDGVGCDAKFTDLKGIAYTPGILYVVDGNRIRKIELP
jgi:hypothetical protein